MLEDNDSKWTQSGLRGETNSESVTDVSTWGDMKGLDVKSHAFLWEILWIRGSLFLAGDSILRLKDSGELKVLIRKSQETVGDKQNKTRHLEWGGVKLRSWRAETDHGELRSMQDSRRT